MIPAPAKAPSRLGPGLAAAAALLLGAGSAGAADPAHPTVVELFQSQGCSSCPPANANFLKIVDRPDVLALSFQVTYWDQLGWRDTFGRPEFTARQWAYARAWRRGQVATPEVVVDGEVDGVGAGPGEIERLIARAGRKRPHPLLRLTPSQLAVASHGPEAPAVVWLVRYDPRTLEIPIQAGENEGKTLPHRNVVRELVRLGVWSGGTKTFALPRAGDGALKTAVLLQAGPGGEIFAAARA